MGTKRKIDFGATRKQQSKQFKTIIRVGDEVLVTTGGNSRSGKVLKGLKGKVLRFLPKKSRVVVEGLNFIKRHKKASSMGETSNVIVKEGSIAIANVMYFSRQLNRPVRLKYQLSSDGRKVRGFINPQSKQFEQVDMN